jgi:aryl-alcohol dehydrogenase-like predicted oxidoreductase
MQKKILGNSDMSLSRIGMGAWAIGGQWQWGWGRQDDRDSIATIHAALDSGINWIDTAPVYGLGHSETLVGKAIKERSEKPYVFTKCGLVWDGENTVTGKLLKASVKKECEESLKRLDVDCIDLYQIHWPNPVGDIEDAWEAMAELLDEGKIRYPGVSNFSVEQMEKLGATCPITSLQPPYSLVFPEVEDEVLPYCRDKGIGVINYSPMASGLLTGKMTRERMATLAEDDWRHKSKHFAEPRFSRNLELVDVLRGIAGEQNCTIAEIAIAWTLLNPAVTGAIVGLRKPEQVGGVIHAGSIRLTGEQLGKINGFLAENQTS